MLDVVIYFVTLVCILICCGLLHNHSMNSVNDLSDEIESVVNYINDLKDRDAAAAESARIKTLMEEVINEYVAGSNGIPPKGMIEDGSVPGDKDPEGLLDGVFKYAPDLMKLFGKVFG